MKIKVKKEYDDVFEAMKDIGEKLFKGDGEPDIAEFLKDGNVVTFDLDEGVEFDVAVKDPYPQLDEVEIDFSEEVEFEVDVEDLTEGNNNGNKQRDQSKS